VTTDDAHSGHEQTARGDHLIRIENALTGINRIINGRDADKVRMRRAGVPITLPRMRLLRLLYERGPMRVVELGTINHMDKGYASRSWRSLATEGYIEVVASDDPRSTTVALTDQGRDIYLRWRRANTDIVGDVLERWRDDELEDLTAVLERLVVSFREVPTPRTVDG
jgi:DNA-binding MarR family transcriptional regulator